MSKIQYPVLITRYSFGHIVIDGKEYSRDVIILPGRVESPWRRRQGHVLVPDDLETVVAAGAAMLIIGTGYSGVMQVADATLAFLKSKGIEARVEKTDQAVQIFNQSTGRSDLAAALHLTC